MNIPQKKRPVILSATNINYKPNYLFVFFFFFSFLLASFVNAELYIWTDENGIKHFSNTAPTVDLDEAVSEEEIGAGSLSDGSLADEAKGSKSVLSGKNTNHEKKFKVQFIISFPGVWLI